MFDLNLKRSRQHRCSVERILFPLRVPDERNNSDIEYLSPAETGRQEEKWGISKLFTPAKQLTTRQLIPDHTMLLFSLSGKMLYII